MLIDSIDVHFLRNARRALHPSGGSLQPGTLNGTFAAEMARELNAYAAADGVMAVSAKEADLIDDLAGGPGLAHVVRDTEDTPPSTVPFAQRRGILFVGNFNHPPNVDACEYLVNDILPRVDSRVLQKHTAYIVGNALSKNLRHLDEVPNVRMVGWVPSLLPYLHHALLTVAPLRYGAGTKRKVIQALMAGTPTVASTIGVEGLGICHGEQALVADDPDTFAAHVTRLATDQQQWESLSRAGRAHVRGMHDRQTVREQFERSLQAALRKPPKQLRLADLVAHPDAVTNASYTALVECIGTTVQAQLPSGASVAVISKGDDALLQLEGLSARHFPSTPSGLYAGHHPADSAAAIALLEAARVEGTEFLVVPRTSFWWLDYYTAFREHLESHYRLLPAGHDTCLIFDLHMEVRT